AKGTRKILSLFQISCFLLGQALEQGLIRPRLANGRFSEKHEPLQIDLLDTDLGRNLHECWELLDSFSEPSKPNGNQWPGVPLPLLQFAKRAHVADDAAEIILATDRLEARAV